MRLQILLPTLARASPTNLPELAPSEVVAALIVLRPSRLHTLHPYRLLRTFLHRIQPPIQPFQPLFQLPDCSLGKPTLEPGKPSSNLYPIDDNSPDGNVEPHMRQHSIPGHLPVWGELLEEFWAKLTSSGFLIRYIKFTVET